MRKLMLGAAALATAALIAVAPTDKARADGGVTVLLIVGGYLLTDAVVGHKCEYRSWPLNIVHKVSGRPCAHWERKKQQKRGGTYQRR